MLQDIPELREKVARCAADAKQMRDLADNGDVHKTFNEAPHNWCKDKAGYPSQAHNSKRQEKNADQDSEGRGERIKSGSALGGHNADSQRRDQTRSGIRADDELT